MKCPSCSSETEAKFFYCPYCGMKLHDKPVESDAGAQIKLYLVSILLPPFGLGLTFKYLRSPDPKARIMGWISVFLTTAVLGAITWLSITWINRLTEEATKQMGTFGF